MISTFQLGSLLAMCADFVIGVLVFLANTRRTVNRVFFAISVVLVFWVYCQFRGTGVRNVQDFSFWVK